MNTYFKKIIASIMVSAVLLVATIPSTTSAQWTVFDAGVTASTTSGTVAQWLTSGQAIMQTLKDFGLDTIIFKLAQMAGTKMANKILNKANGGASGDDSQQSYVTNFYQFFEDIEMTKADEFLSQLEVSNSPYATGLMQSFIQEYKPGGTGVPDPLNEFTLGEIIGPNYKDFANDASVGGWEGFLALSNPANTNIGSALIAKKNLGNSVYNAKEIERLRLISPGFTPQGKCNLDWEEYRNNINSIRLAKDLKNDSGGGGSEIETTVVDDSYTGSDHPDNEFENAPDESSPDIVDSTGGTNANALNDNSGLNGVIADSATGLTEDYGKCLEEAINNPMGLTQLATGMAATEAFESLGEIDTWGEMIAGVFLKMFDSFVQTGLGSLRGDFQKANQGIGGPEQLVSRNGQPINYSAVPLTVVNLPETFEDSIANTEEEIAHLKKYIDYATGNIQGTPGFIASIHALDVCLPGPDSQYETRLDAYFARKTKKLQRKQFTGKEDVQDDRVDAMADAEISMDYAKSEIELLLQSPQRNIPGSSIMQQQVNRLPEVRRKYQNKKTQLLEKQAALGLLYKLESDLEVSMEKLRGYVPGLPANIAFTSGGINRLTPGEKTALLNWAKTVSGTTTVGTDPGQQNEFIMSTVWDVWTNPDTYITQNKARWETRVDGKSPADIYLEEKNMIRGEYNSMGERLAVPRNIEQAQLDVNDIVNLINQTNELTADCNLIKGIVLANGSLSGRETGHEQMTQILKNRQNEFRSEEVKILLDGKSILSSPIGWPAGMNCSGNNCSQGTGFGGNNDRYQVPPAKSIWDLVAQDTAKTVFCTFNNMLVVYHNQGRRVPGEPMYCTEGGTTWYAADESDLSGYFFGDSFE